MSAPREDAKRRQEEEERRRREREESARRQAEEEARLQAEAEARRRAEEEARRRAPQAEVVDDEPVEAKSKSAPSPRSATPVRRVVTPEVARPVKAKGEEDRRRGKLTLNTALSDDDSRVAFAVGHASPPGEVQAGDASGAAREDRARSHSA